MKIRTFAECAIPDQGERLLAKKNYRMHPVDVEDPRASEALMDARSAGLLGVNFYHRKDNPPYHHVVPGSIPEIFLRASVIEKLLQVETHLIPLGYRLFLMDGWRPQAVQRYFYEDWVPNMLRTEHPQWPEEVIHRETATYWAAPALDDFSVDPLSPPPHSTGAAVDLVLATLDGEPVPFGTEFDEVTERSHMGYLESGSRDLGAQAHRRILFHAMEAEGFVGNPTEVWHYSYGDQMWAAITSALQGRLHKAHYSSIRPH